MQQYFLGYIYYWQDNISLWTDILLTRYIILQVPDAVVDGRWQLRVQGQDGVMALFKRLTDLQFQAKFLTILIQPSRPVYNAGQTGEHTEKPGHVSLSVSRPVYKAGKMKSQLLRPVFKDHAKIPVKNLPVLYIVP